MSRIRVLNSHQHLLIRAFCSHFSVFSGLGTVCSSLLGVYNIARTSLRQTSMHAVKWGPESTTPQSSKILPPDKSDAGQVMKRRRRQSHAPHPARGASAALESQFLGL